MTTPIPISEREPVLPCELWHSELRCWIRATTAADYMPYPSNPATHWRPLPDSPKAPAVVPEQFKVKAHQFTGDKSLLHTGRLAPGERAYAGTPPAAPSPEAMKLASAIGCMSRNSERPWQNLFDDGSPLATDAARLIDAHTAAKDEEIAEANIECGRLKAREVTLTDRQVYVQMALKKFNFNFQAGEGLPELVERVAGMASAYRARDNIGMSREEYHKAKKAITENDDLRTRLTTLSAAAEGARVALADIHHGADVAGYSRIASLAADALSALTETLKQEKKP